MKATLRRSPHLARIVNGAAGMMLWALLFAAGLFVGMVVLQQVGHGIATKRIALDPEGAKKGASVSEEAIRIDRIRLLPHSSRDITWPAARHAAGCIR